MSRVKVKSWTTRDMNAIENACVYNQKSNAVMTVKTTKWNKLPSLLCYICVYKYICKLKNIFKGLDYHFHGSVQSKTLDVS